MILFDEKQDNSEKTFEIAMKRATELHAPIVIATTTGQTALRFMECAKKSKLR